MAENAETTKTSDEQPSVPHVPNVYNYPAFSNAGMQMFPIFYPAVMPGATTPPQNQEQNNHGAGIYAVPVVPFMGSMTAVSPNTLIPLCYNVPDRRPNTSEGEMTAERHGQDGRQNHAPQRINARRFQFGFQLDLMLIVKLAAVVFLFNPDGSRQRLILLLCFATFIYLYQTGALTPFKRWLSQRMQRAVAPVQRRPVVRAENAAAGRADDHQPAVGADDGLAVRPENQNPNQHEAASEVEYENQNLVAANNDRLEPGAAGGINWLGIVKEIQVIVLGFITSLFPGMHNAD